MACAPCDIAVERPAGGSRKLTGEIAGLPIQFDDVRMLTGGLCGV